MNTSYHAQRTRRTVSAKKHEALRVQLHTVVAPEFLLRNDGLAQCRGESHLRLTSTRRVRICSGFAFERLDLLFISHVVLSSGNGRRSCLGRVKNRRVRHVCFLDLAWEPRLSSARERGGMRTYRKLSDVTEPWWKRMEHIAIIQAWTSLARDASNLPKRPHNVISDDREAANV
jgi:hypothetical protein